MPITLLDGILVGFTLVSALLAMVRGFSREVLSIASWIAAAAAAYFFWRPVVPYVETYVRPYSDDPRAAIFVAAAIVFVIALIIVTLITMKIADAIINSRIGALDRTLGFLYGAARGILVVAVCLMLFDWIVGDKRPDWVAKAKSAPMLDKVSAWIESKLPEVASSGMLEKIIPNDPDPEQPGTPDAPAPDAPADNPPAENPPAENPPANN